VDGGREGTGWVPVNARGKLRRSASVSYLHPLSELPDNLTVRTTRRRSASCSTGARRTGVESTGGGHDGLFHEPTILDGVTSDMRIAQEETFGPVAPIMTFGTLDEALEIANGTKYGLTAAVFTRSLHDAWRAAEELRHGTVHINETTNYWDQLAPFGGAKASGAGRELAGGSSTL
jgi:acyl-CoA reductase-like NAD-dependent aldehyde dehydrogenase